MIYCLVALLSTHLGLCMTELTGIQLEEIEFTVAQVKVTPTEVDQSTLSIESLDLDCCDECKQFPFWWRGCRDDRPDSVRQFVERNPSLIEAAEEEMKDLPTWESREIVIRRVWLEYQKWMKEAKPEVAS